MKKVHCISSRNTTNLKLIKIRWKTWVMHCRILRFFSKAISLNVAVDDYLLFFLNCETRLFHLFLIKEVIVNYAENCRLIVRNKLQKKQLDCSQCLRSCLNVIWKPWIRYFDIKILATSSDEHILQWKTYLLKKCCCKSL